MQLASWLAITVVVLAVGSPGLAGAKAVSLCPSGPVRAAMYEAGFFYFDGKGIDREILTELMRRAGCAFEVSAPPRARAYALLEAGQIDIVFAALANANRDGYASYIPYMQQRFATIINRDVPIEKTSLHGFTSDTSLRFGAVRGVTYGGGRDIWYYGIESANRLELGASLSTVFKMLKFKRFDAMFAIPLQYEKELADAGMRDQVRIVDWFPEEPSTPRNLAVSKKNFSSEQLQALTLLVQTMQADGTIKRILERYLTPAEALKATLKPPMRTQSRR